MKTYPEIISNYKLVIWDGVKSIKCPTGVFTAEEIKKHWKIGEGTSVYYIVKGRNRTVPFMYGSDTGSPYDSEDVVECGKLNIKDLAEQEYRLNLAEGESFIECDMETLEANLLIEDQRG